MSAPVSDRGSLIGSLLTRVQEPGPLQRLWLWLPVVGYMAGIFFASGTSDPPMPEDVPDVSLHAAAYFGLTILLVRAIARERWRGVTLKALVLAFLIASAYGVTDEWHQSFVPGRHPDWNDLFADAFGALAASATVGAWGIIRRL